MFRCQTHRPPRSALGASEACEAPLSSMVIHGHPWSSMVIHGHPWSSMVLPEARWIESSARLGTSSPGKVRLYHLCHSRLQMHRLHIDCTGDCSHLESKCFLHLSFLAVLFRWKVDVQMMLSENTRAVFLFCHDRGSGLSLLVLVWCSLGVRCQPQTGKGESRAWSPWQRGWDVEAMAQWEPAKFVKFSYNSFIQFLYTFSIPSASWRILQHRINSFTKVDFKLDSLEAWSLQCHVTIQFESGCRSMLRFDVMFWYFLDCFAVNSHWITIFTRFFKAFELPFVQEPTPGPGCRPWCIIGAAWCRGAPFPDVTERCRTSEEREKNIRHTEDTGEIRGITMDNMKSADQPFGIAEQSSNVTLAQGWLEASLEWPWFHSADAFSII